MATNCCQKYGDNYVDYVNRLFSLMVHQYHKSHNYVAKYTKCWISMETYGNGVQHFVNRSAVGHVHNNQSYGKKDK